MLYKKAFSKGKKTFVRINQFEDYNEMISDIEHLTIKGVGGFVIPKSNAACLNEIESIVKENEKKKWFTIKFY